MKENDQYYCGADDYTYCRGIHSTNADYLRGYYDAEKESKKLALNWLNYP